MRFYALALLVLAACGGDDRPRRSGAAAGDSGRADMGSAALPSGAAADAAREDEIVRHLRAVQDADPERLAREFPEYRRELEEALADFEREMIEMNLDSREWRIRLADVRADLARMDTMPPVRLRRAWRAHAAARVEELVHMHAWMNGRVRER